MASAKVEEQREKLLDQAAAIGKSLIILTPNELIEMVARLGGGAAAGATALSNSMHSLTETIERQANRIEALQVQAQGLLQKLAGYQETNLLAQQWSDGVSLKRQQLTQEGERSREMMAFSKLAGLGALSFAQGGNALEMLGGLGLGDLGLGGPPGAPPGGPPWSPPPSPAAPPSGTAKPRGAKGGAGGLAELARAALERLSPETVDVLIDELAKPNEQMGNVPTLVALARAIISSLDVATLGRLRDDIGPELMQQLFNAMRASAPSAAPTAAPGPSAPAAPA